MMFFFGLPDNIQISTHQQSWCRLAMMTWCVITLRHCKSLKCISTFKVLNSMASYEQVTYWVAGKDLFMKSGAHSYLNCRLTKDDTTFHSMYIFSFFIWFKYKVSILSRFPRVLCFHVMFWFYGSMLVWFVCCCWTADSFLFIFFEEKKKQTTQWKYTLKGIIFYTL